MRLARSTKVFMSVIAIVAVFIIAMLYYQNEQVKLSNMALKDSVIELQEEYRVLEDKYETTLDENTQLQYDKHQLTDKKCSLEDKVEEKKKEVEKLKSKPKPKPETKFRNMQSTGEQAITAPKKSSSKGSYKTFTATAYCPCKKCNGKWVGKPTASGTTLTPGRTIAVDPNVIPLGSRVEIKGLGVFTAEDVGGAIKGNIIDILKSNHSEANKWGRQSIQLRVLD